MQFLSLGIVHHRHLTGLERKGSGTKQSPLSLGSIRVHSPGISYAPQKDLESLHFLMKFGRTGETSGIRRRVKPGDASVLPFSSEIGSVTSSLSVTAQWFCCFQHLVMGRLAAKFGIFVK